MILMRLSKTDIDIDILKERPLCYHRTMGLTLSQMQELVCRIHGALAKPWNLYTAALV